MTQATQKLLLPFPVLVIIPCLNEALHIVGLVETLLGQLFSRPASLIIIADGGSTDGTIELARALEMNHDMVRYMDNPQRLQSAAVNLAVGTFGKNFDYFVRIDAHANYPSDFISVLVREAQNQHAASVVVLMDTVGRQSKQKAIATAQNSRLGNGGSQHRLAGQANGQWVDHGHHALMRINAFQSVGGYDESFSHNEDAELDIRMGQSGHKIWLTGATHVNYFPRTSFSGLARQYFNFGSGRARTTFKHQVPLKLRQLLPAILFPVSFLVVFSPFLWILALPFVSWVTLVLIFGTQTALHSDDDKSVTTVAHTVWAVCIMHMAWSAGFCRSYVAFALKRRSRIILKGHGT